MAKQPDYWYVVYYMIADHEHAVYRCNSVQAVQDFLTEEAQPDANIEIVGVFFGRQYEYAIKTEFRVKIDE